uniref:RNA polymerase sigma factor region1.1 domain-containing protein n=1 Tax=Candidatus Chloroploca sp. Khr17 TaxID=2496869 RepID=UPI00272E4912
APAAAAEDDVDLTPFSLDDLGLSADEIAQLEAAVPAEEAAPAAAAEDDVDLTPFSLDDLGLSADELANFEAAIAAEEAGKGQEMRQTQGTEEEGTAAFSEMIDLDLNFDDLQPFSLDDLDLSNLEEGTEGLPSFLQPFSLEEATATPSEKEAPERDEPEIFSWQEPAARERTSFGQQEEPEPSGVSIFGKLTQQAAERPPHEPPPLAPVDDEEAEASGYFSDDDVALREEMSGRPERFVSGFRLPREGEELAAEAPAEVEPTQVEPAEFTLSPPPEQDVDLTPFSLADLGLSPEEIAALEAEAAEGAAMTASSEMGLLGDDVDLTPFSLADLGLSPEEIAALEGVELPEATPGEDVDLTPFSLADLGLSPEEIAALEASNQDQFNLPVTGETIVPGWSRGEEPELIPFSPQVEPPITPEEATPERLETDQPASELSTDEALEFTDIFEGDVQPFSFDEFELETGEPRTREHDDEGISGDVQPFSLDDLDLGDLDAFAPDAEERKLGVTSEELAGLDLGNLESMTGERPSLKIADDPAAALGHLTTLGQQQGYVDLTDIISMVSDPETEADQIEQMAWSLHHAGIQIRDGDEIIDLEGEAESEELEAIGDVFDAEARLAESQPSSPELEPFSLNELGLSDDELAALGLASLDQPEAAAPGPPEGEDADLTPFSLADLGLTPDEIALFEADLSEETEEPGPAMVPTSEPEAELEPFSLTDLGLSPDEIAMLEASVEQADLLGASTDQDASAPTVDATGEEEPGSTEAIDEDEFNFDLTEATPVERVTARTEPRIEAPVTEADPADTDFEPEPLDNLDDIWDASAEEAEPLTPARVVLPPMSERFAEPPPPPRPTSITPTVPPASPPLSRDEERYARREAATRRYREQERQPRRFQQAEATAALATAAEFAGFVPTGDTLLDDYLGQLDEEPDNHGLAMAIGHLCAQTNRPDIMTRAFKRVIRAGQGLEQIVSELETLMASVEEPAIKQPLTRLLGDAYSKQGRYTEAMQAYGATFTR